MTTEGSKYEMEAKAETMNTKTKTEIKEEPGFFSYENLRSLFVLVLIILAIRWSIASPYHVPTPSMEPTIKVGDRLLAFKLAYNLKIPFTDFVVAEWGQIKRGDIIVFKYPKDTSLDYVKRVVGLPGDRIRLVDDVLYINDVAQARINHNDDRSILRDITEQTEYKELFQETLDGVKHWTMNSTQEMRGPGASNWHSSEDYLVPIGSVFTIGDNRDNSADGRVWGEIPLEYVKGKALFVIWSMYTEKGELLPKIRWNRFFTKLQ